MALGRKHGPDELSLEPQQWKTGPLQQRTKKKLDKAAVIAAQVLNGTWDWGDQKPPRHDDGTYRCPKNWLLAQVGWSPLSNSARRFFQHEYWRDALAKEMRRVSHGYSQELAFITREGELPSNLSRLAYESLMRDLEDPNRAQRIKFSERVALWKASTELAAKVEGDARTKGGMNLTRSVQAVIDERGETVELNQMKVHLAPPIENVEAECEEE